MCTLIIGMAADDLQPIATQSRETIPLSFQKIPGGLLGANNRLSSLTRL